MAMGLMQSKTIKTGRQNEYKMIDFLWLKITDCDWHYKCACIMQYTNDHDSVVYKADILLSTNCLSGIIAQFKEDLKKLKPRTLPHIYVNQW